MTQFQWKQIHKFFPDPKRFGDPALIKWELMRPLEDWVKFSGYDFTVTCGTQGSHEKNSEHYTGEAVDGVCPLAMSKGANLLDIAHSAMRFGFKSVGIYPYWSYNNKRVGGLHLGVRPRPYTALWMGILKDGKQEYVALNVENLRAHGVI